MPASLVEGQVATGGVNSTSFAVTLPAGTTAGNTVFVVFGTVGRTMATTAGFTIDSPSSIAAARIQVFRRSNVPAGESSWTFTTGVAAAEAWVAFEVEGLDASTPLDVVVSAVSAASSGTAITSNTTPQSTAYDEFVLAAWVGTIVGTTPGTLSGITNGFAEIGQAGASGTNSAVVSVASLPAASLATFSSTATHSATLTATVPGAGVALVYAAAGSRRQANVVGMCGFEAGTTAGWAAPANGVVDVVGGSPAIVATNPRTGAYCLELSAAAAAEYVQWLNAFTNYGSSTNYGVAGFAVCFPSALPGADLDLGHIAAALNGTGAYLRYRSASQKLGVSVFNSTAVTSGTEQLSAGTVAADTWYWVDLRMDGSTTTGAADWALDGVLQVQATHTISATVLATLALGWTGAASGTVRYDDMVFSRIPGHFPIGPVAIYPLKADPAGTLTISGTTGNFQVMTANGTLAAWNAANALAAIDDIPPTIGATADGVVQSTTAASDYVAIPMETRDAAANGEAIRGVRWYFPMWAASATAATIGLRGYDGAAETTLFSVADPGADNSTTTPVWICRMQRTLSVAAGPSWTQAKLDGLTARVGFSGDASPAVGIHAVLAEVAMRAGETRSVTGDAGALSTSAEVDPDSGAIIAATLDATAVPLGATLRWTDSGGPGSQVVAAGATGTRTFPAAVDVSEVTWIEVDPDPDPDQPG